MATGRLKRDAVGVRQFDGFLFGTALGGLESHVASNNLDSIADMPKLPQPVVAHAPSHAADQRCLAHSAGDGDEHDIVFVQILTGEFGVELGAFLVQLEQTRRGLGSLENFGVRRQGGRTRSGRGCPVTGNGHGLVSVGSRRFRFVAGRKGLIAEGNVLNDRQQGDQDQSDQGKSSKFQALHHTTLRFADFGQFPMCPHKHSSDFRCCPNATRFFFPTFCQT